ncbi:MAG: 2-amino-4-hydroxy-6-hydroxymethyldihydropteridine diphosphokinase [Bacteroides sp.]|nr:2-amino-4-hydroxy-6-hydroxymethyldihydropteridine diphosphokinase [Bacteroides sp.]
MALAIVGLGSNKGHRRSIIERAVALISRIPDIYEFRCSELMETEPWGFESDNKFLNACVAFETDMPPEVLFGKLQEIERSISEASHRDSTGRYVDREIDIDFIAYGTQRVSLPGLILPHPRAMLRDFVMIPFEEIAPGLCAEIKSMTTDNSL